MIAVMAACGPDPDEIVKRENKKLSDLEAAEAVRVEEVMGRIREESEMIAKGGVLPARRDSMAKDTLVAAVPAPVSRQSNAPAERETIPHHIQLGAFTSPVGAKTEAEAWQKRGFANVIHLENPNAQTEYRFVVRLTGFTGYSSAFAESQRINTQYRIRSYPLQVR